MDGSVVESYQITVVHTIAAINTDMFKSNNNISLRVSKCLSCCHTDSGEGSKVLES